MKFNCILCDKCGVAHSTTYNCVGDKNWKKQDNIRKSMKDFEEMLSLHQRIDKLEQRIKILEDTDG